MSRRVPIPILPDVQAELLRMEAVGSSRGRTRQMTEPMGPVVKKSSNIRMCVDLKKLIESVVRPKHRLPMLDDMLYKLKGLTVFSQVDVSSGIWHVTLEGESSRLMTFIMSFGSFQLLRLQIWSYTCT